MPNGGIRRAGSIDVLLKFGQMLRSAPKKGKKQILRRAGIAAHQAKRPGINGAFLLGVLVDQPQAVQTS